MLELELNDKTSSSRDVEEKRIGLCVAKALIGVILLPEGEPGMTKERKAEAVFKVVKPLGFIRLPPPLRPASPWIREKERRYLRGQVYVDRVPRRLERCWWLPEQLVGHRGLP